MRCDRERLHRPGESGIRPTCPHWSEPRLVDVASKIPGAGHGLGARGRLGSGPRTVDRVLGHQNECGRSRGQRCGGTEQRTRRPTEHRTTPPPADFPYVLDPVKWIDRKNVIIDTTMLRDDDGWWYRASKDSEITIERTRNPYAVAREVLRTDDPERVEFRRHAHRSVG